MDYEALFREAVSDAHRQGPHLVVGSRRVAVVSEPYLIAMKLVAARPQDEADVDALLRNGALDYAAVRAVVHRHLGVFAAEYLDRLARRARRADAPKEYGPGDS